MIRMKHPKLLRDDKGNIFAEYYDFVYYFIGEKSGTLTFNGEPFGYHPTFKNIDQFEGWVRRYYAEQQI